VPEEQETTGANRDEWWQLVDLQQNQSLFPNKIKGIALDCKNPSPQKKVGE